MEGQERRPMPAKEPKFFTQFKVFYWDWQNPARDKAVDPNNIAALITTICSEGGWEFVQANGIQYIFKRQQTRP